MPYEVRVALGTSDGSPLRFSTVATPESNLDRLDSWQREPAGG